MRREKGAFGVFSAGGVVILFFCGPLLNMLRLCQCVYGACRAFPGMGPEMVEIHLRAGPPGVLHRPVLRDGCHYDPGFHAAVHSDCVFHCPFQVLEPQAASCGEASGPDTQAPAGFHIIQ